MYLYCFHNPVHLGGVIFTLIIQINTGYNDFKTYGNSLMSAVTGIMQVNLLLIILKALCSNS